MEEGFTESSLNTCETDLEDWYLTEEFSKSQDDGDDFDKGVDNNEENYEGNFTFPSTFDSVSALS